MFQIPLLRDVWACHLRAQASHQLLNCGSLSGRGSCVYLNGCVEKHGDGMIFEHLMTKFELKNQMCGVSGSTHLFCSE